MSVLRLALRRARLSTASRRVYFYGRAHPRMDAALKAVNADWKTRSSCRRAIFCCARGNKNHRPEVQALGRWYRVAGKSIQVRNKPAAKSSDLCERVNFAAAVLNNRRPANVQVRLAGLVAPRVYILRFFQFFDELSKCSLTVTDARALAQHCIEAGGFTIVQHSKLLITLNSAGTDSETQYSNRRKRRPDCCAKTKPFLHEINLLDCAGPLSWEANWTRWNVR